MSKTLYIETNEEVTAIIDRIKNIADAEVVLVIPKKAAILQSILNLKILKRQLGDLGKQAVIVTSDKLGKNIASRADFIVKQKLDWGNSTRKQEEKNEFKPPIKSITSDLTEKKVNPPIRQIDFPKLKMSDIIKRGNDDIFVKLSEDNQGEQGPKIQTTMSPNNISQAEEEQKSDDIEKNNTIPKKIRMFIKKPPPKKKVILLPSFGKKLFFAISLATLLIVGIVLFLILPTAVVVVEPKTQLITQDIDLIIDKTISEVDKNELKVPGKLIEVSKEATKEFSATGKKQIKEKALGTIIVYNEWDSQSQTLVENTRFISDNGKLFKSIKTAVVPGFKRSAGQDIAGSTTVTVAADEPGEESNIKPSRFSIPGLKGTIKYDKIYGVSTEPMTGGRVEQINVVSEDDFSKAKKMTEESLRGELINEIKDKSDVQSSIVDNAISTNKAEFTSTKKIGEEAKSFALTLKINGAALAFSESDIISLSKDTVKAPFSNYSLVGEPKLTYGQADLDLKNGKMSLKVYSEITASSRLEKNSILENIKGKDVEELQNYFANISEAGNVDVKFWPFWVKSIPRIESKINVDIK